MKYTIYEIILIFCLILFAKSDDTPNVSSKLTDFINNIEAKVKKLALTSEKLFSAKCHENCDCSYNSCSTLLPDLQCNSNYILSQCKNCYKPGTMLSMSTSVLKMDNNIQLTRDMNETICVTAGLEEQFQENSLEPAIKWQSIGLYNGLFRGFPGNNWCDSFDPRTRSWYVSASTGSKNVIFVLDFSGSMLKYNRANLMKQAIYTVIDTLTIYDKVGFVSFTGTAKKYKDTLITANKQNKDELKAYIESLQPGGGTNFEDAFNKGYQILEDTKSDDGCHTLFMFMTDGRPTDGEMDDDKLTAMIKQKYNTNKSMIMTYGLGNEPDTDFLKGISCATQGKFENVPNITMLISATKSYYDIIATGIDRTNVVWVEPYLDASQLGNMTSASFPVYDKSVSPTLLIGVVSIDILMSDLYKYGDNIADVLKSLITRSNTCTKMSLTDCQLDTMRKQKCLVSDSACESVKTALKSCGDTKLNAFCEGTILLNSMNQTECCGENQCVNGTNTNVIIVPPVDNTTISSSNNTDTNTSKNNTSDNINTPIINNNNNTNTNVEPVKNTTNSTDTTDNKEEDNRGGISSGIIWFLIIIIIGGAAYLIYKKYNEQKEAGFDQNVSLLAEKRRQMEMDLLRR